MSELAILFVGAGIGGASGFLFFGDGEDSPNPIGARVWVGALLGFMFLGPLLLALAATHGCEVVGRDALGSVCE